MSELHDSKTASQQILPAASPMLNSMPYRTHKTHGYEARFGSPIPAERTYGYSSVQGYQTIHEKVCSAPLPPEHCDENSSISAVGTIEPLHLNILRQDGPWTAFEDNHRTCQFLNDGQHYLDSDSIQPSAYYLEDGFHALQEARFSSASTFETTQRGLYQSPYSDPVTPPNGSRSPMAGWSRLHRNTIESSSRGEYTTVQREDLEDVGSDKPYARLIWEALMQAPGHRMMLREIYAWFQCNTNKARESGSNGWQNSIRHNLSMNQAFENDKSDSSTSRGQTKKANSVWVLTENAIKDGVQSTTRYRKTGSGKKTHTSRTPAPLRQKSGAKGGRAARRAAKLRRNEQDRFSNGVSLPGISSPPDSFGSIGMDGITNEPDYMSIHTPTTPSNDLSYSFSAAFNVPAYSIEVPLFYNGEEDYVESAASVQHEFVIQPQKGPCSDEMEHFPYGSNRREFSM